MKTVTFDEVWESEFAPAVAQRVKRETEARTDAFLDVELQIAGEPVRQMTPHDLLILDALGNPFVCGGVDSDVLMIDCIGLIWQLSPLNDHSNSLRNLWRRARLIRRVGRLALVDVATQVAGFVERMFMDFGTGDTDQTAAPTTEKALRPSPRTHFIAPLIVQVAAEIGHVDPMNGELLAHTPLPRLVQYARTLSEARGSQKIYDEQDSLRNKCVARMNELNAAARAGAAGGTA